MFVLLIVSLLFAAAPASESGATRINQIFVQLKAPKPKVAVQQFKLKEVDLNEFVAVALKDKQRLGVKKIVLDLQESGGLRAEATINMDDVKIDMPGIGLFKTLLSGTQVLKAEGRFICKERKAHYELDKASINDVWVPAWLAEAVVAMVGKTQPPHVDITEEFDLPYGITGVTTHVDRVEITR